MGWIPGVQGKWEGGCLWEDKDGQRTYVIRRMVAGKRYEVSSRCTRLAPALEQLAAFQTDPEGYDAAVPTGEPLRLTADLVRAFLAYSGGTRRTAGRATRARG